MSLRSAFSALVFIAAAASSSVARAESRQAECFAKQAPARVVPYHVQKWVGQGAYSALAGARIFFWAQPGLTAEWLHRQLAERVAEQHNESRCPLDVPGVSIRVQSAGPGFWLEISASEAAPAAEVWRRAQAVSPR